MGELVADLLISSNWASLYAETHQAEPVSGFPNRYLPITIQAPVVAESPILRGFCTSEDAREWWYKGCDCSVRIETFGIETEVARGTLPLGHRKLILAPREVSSTFRIYFQIPWWHKSLYISLDQYTGPIDDSTELLLTEQVELVRVDLLRIEGKINTLLTP